MQLTISNTHIHRPVFSSVILGHDIQKATSPRIIVNIPVALGKKSTEPAVAGRVGYLKVAVARPDWKIALFQLRDADLFAGVA